MNPDPPHSPVLEDPSSNSVPGGKFIFPQEEGDDFFLSETAFFSQLESPQHIPLPYDKTVEASVSDSSSSDEKSTIQNDSKDDSDEEECQEIDEGNAAGDVVRAIVPPRDPYDDDRDVQVGPPSHWSSNDIKPVTMINFAEVPIKVGLSRKAKYKPLHPYLKTNSVDKTKPEVQRKRKNLSNED